MTLGELREEILRRLREASDGSEVFWRDTDVEYAINEAYMEISDATEWNEKWQIVDLLVDRPYYDARTLMRDECLVLGPAFNLTTNRWLTMTTTWHLDLRDFWWESRMEEPEYVVTRGLWWVKYWPHRNSEDGRVKQYYIAVPDPLEDEDDEPGFHRNFHYGLVEYVLWDLFAQDGEYSLAYAAWKEYLTYEAKLSRYVEQRNAIPMSNGWMESR